MPSSPRIARAVGHDPARYGSGPAIGRAVVADKPQAMAARLNDSGRKQMPGSAGTVHQNREAGSRASVFDGQHPAADPDRNRRRVHDR